MKTNRAKILQYLKKRGFITKRIAAGYHWNYGLGDHIAQLRKHHNITTHMFKNKTTGSRYALYSYKGKK